MHLLISISTRDQIVHDQVSSTALSTSHATLPPTLHLSLPPDRRFSSLIVTHPTFPFYDSPFLPFHPTLENTTAGGFNDGSGGGGGTVFDRTIRELIGGSNLDDEGT